VGLSHLGDGWHGFAAGEPELGEFFAGGPGVECFDVQGDVFAGVAAAHHLPGLFPGHREHHPAKQQSGVVLLQPRAINDALIPRGQARAPIDVFDQ